jgi:hypothetical protein
MPDQESVSIKPQERRLPYRLRERFLSAPERAFFGVLQKMVGRHYVICPKVALDDLFYIVRPNENVHFFNKFFRKHIDFLLCDPDTLKPSMGIALVKRAVKAETTETDQFMEDLFLSAGLPFVQVQSSEHYSEKALQGLFEAGIKRVQDTKPLRAATKMDSVPMCPICGRMMVLRIHRHGSDAGKKYYGCSDNPHCPGMVPINQA